MLSQMASMETDIQAISTANEITVTILVSAQLNPIDLFSGLEK